MKVCTLLQRQLITLQNRPGSQQSRLRLEVRSGKTVVIGTVSSFHALQDVIKQYGNSVVYDINIKCHESTFKFDPNTSLSSQTEHEAA